LWLFLFTQLENAVSRFWHWENAKIAESLEISIHTVENQLYNALLIFKRKLKKDD